MTNHIGAIYAKRKNLVVVTNQIGCILWWQLDRTTMWLNIQMRSTLRTILNYRDQSDWGGLWWKLERTKTWSIIKVQFTPKLKLSSRDLSERVRSVTKPWEDNDMNDHTNVVYVENKTELQCLIELGMVCDKNKTGQRCDQSYKFGRY